MPKPTKGQKRVTAAQLIVDRLAAEARIAQARYETARNRGLDGVTLDRLASYAEQTRANEKDAREQAKRLKKRTDELARQTTVDLRAAKKSPPARPQPTPYVPARLTMPEPETAPPVQPPREGLLPGEYKIDKRVIGSLMNGPAGGRITPTRWTAEHVAHRLREAFDVLKRIRMTIGPKEFGAAWPAYQFEAGELVWQVETNAMADRNKVVLGTTADEVARMEEAIVWPTRYLRDDPFSAEEVNEFCRRSNEEDEPPAAARDALELIALRLNQELVRVR